jgi:hypothetical protein
VLASVVVMTLVVMTKCCNCMRPESIPGCVKCILMSEGVRFSGKDDVLQLCEARIVSWLSKTHFRPHQVYALILCRFEPDVLLNFKAPVAET